MFSVPKTQGFSYALSMVAPSWRHMFFSSIGILSVKAMVIIYMCMRCYILPNRNYNSFHAGSSNFFMTLSLDITLFCPRDQSICRIITTLLPWNRNVTVRLIRSGNHLENRHVFCCWGVVLESPISHTSWHDRQEKRYTYFLGSCRLGMFGCMSQKIIAMQTNFSRHLTLTLLTYKRSNTLCIVHILMAMF